MKLSITGKLVTGLMAIYLSVTTMAENPNSITLIDSSSFGIDATEIQGFREKMQAAVDGDFISGAILLVGNDKGVGVLETVGNQGPDDDTPMSQDTLFRIYSMTKPIVSVATMSMVEDGLIAIEDPVSKYIPEFAKLSILDEATGKTSPASNIMTVENLLTHESGLIYGIFDPQSKLGSSYLESGSLSFDITGLELSQRLAKLPLRFEPGTKWHYSRSTDVLGAVLEVAAGKPLDQILQERILGPLGMDDTSFYVPAHKANLIAQPIHGEMADPLEVMPMLSGGGGLHSSTEDYVRFAAMLLNGGIYRGNRIIEKSTLDLMTSDYIGDTVSREYFFFRNSGDWGLGFNLQPSNMRDQSSPRNFGWSGVGGTDFIVDPTNNFFAIYMVQFRDGPSGIPFDLNRAKMAVYRAMAD